MNNKLSLNSISSAAFQVNAGATGEEARRADIISKGRMLYFAQAEKGRAAMQKASGMVVNAPVMLTSSQYSQLNEQFRREHLLYAAEKVCAMTGAAAPQNYDGFMAVAQGFYGSKQFYAVLEGIYQEVINPILPAVFSEAVSWIADVVPVALGQSYKLTVGSNDIPIFQDSAWGAQRSVPRNRFYDKTYTLMPSPKTAQIAAKWMQLIGNGQDFGRFFANLTAGLYAKVMGMWNEAMVLAASDPALIPSGLTFTFSNDNWIIAANKLAALNNTDMGHIIAIGGALPLSKVLPTEGTASAHTAMDAALVEMLGADWVRSGSLGEFLKVRLMPMRDAIVPGTQNSTVQTILSQRDIWMMATNGYKPLTIAMNTGMPMTLDMDPTKTGDMEIGMNLTTSLDIAAIFASKIAHFTI